MATSDFNFSFDGMFYRLLPNNAQAVAIFNQIAEDFEGCVIPLHAFPSVKLQLKQAGYSVRKVPPVSAKVDDDALLAELLA